MAKKTGGRFILRIEDTDVERSTQEYTDSILDAMKWLGLSYDEGPFFQTQRQQLYQEHVQKLLDEGKAFRCFCSVQDLEKKRELAMKEGRKPKYDGTCRPQDSQSTALPANDARPHCIRFRSTDEGKTLVHDLIRGDIEFDNAELDDLIIVRSDGTPTYNFVVVVDDVTMQMTHVIRGDDHLNNSPRQIQLYQAFDYPVPAFAHVPMILGSDKKRLSKRHGATSVLAYRDLGFLPEALLNYLVRLGWAHGDDEVFSLDQLCEYFDIQDVGKSSAVFNEEKLLWLNGLWIRQSSPERLLEATRPFLEAKGLDISDIAYTQKALKSCQEKVKTLLELADMASFYFVELPEISDELRAKFLNPDGIEILTKLAQGLASVENFDVESLTAWLHEFSEVQGLKFGKIAQPLRAALTGTNISPGIYDVMAVLGKDRVLARLHAAL